ncbi:MAG: Lpg1974 family pore-forming outer membrane protein [Chlamydiae bacterium]|nr:Lpg1974 family pore-forming outer membrane protein [Chlamydiota bacterium]
MRTYTYFLCSSLLSVSAFAGVENFSLPMTPPETEGQEKSAIKFFFDGSFTYWYGKQEGMEIAETGIVSSSGVVDFNSHNKVFSPSFSYQPGFKVGFGLQGNNDWNLQADYTWFRGSDTTSKSAHANDTENSGSGVWVLDDWFLQTSSTGQSISGSHVKSNWHLALDQLDIFASNPIYMNKNIVVTSMYGLRTTFIGQKMNIKVTEDLGSTSSLPSQPIHSKNKSHCWGIGPQAGLDMQYHLPMGFRFEGDLMASLLYTTFTKIKHEEDAILTTTSELSTSWSNYTTMRPVIDLGLGIGWKKDLSGNKYCIDFSASYDFSMYWGQNIMRKMLDEFWSGTSAAASDLFFQGLTLNAAFTF